MVNDKPCSEYLRLVFLIIIPVYFVLVIIVITHASTCEIGQRLIAVDVAPTIFVNGNQPTCIIQKSVSTLKMN